MSRAIFGVGAASKGGKIWPTTTADADDTHFVFDFTGITGANAVGAGWELTGPDLIATQFGNVGASVDGWRPITLGSPQGFTVTPNWLNALHAESNAPDGFGLLYHLKGISHPVGIPGTHDYRRICELRGDGTHEFLFFQGRYYRNPSNEEHRYVLDCGTGESNASVSFSRFNAAVGNTLLDNSEVWMVLSYDMASSMISVGFTISEEQPVTLDDLDVLTTAEVVVPSRIETLALTSDIILGHTSDALGLKVKSITAGRRPFGS